MKRSIALALGILCAVSAVSSEKIRLEKSKSLREVTDFIPVNSQKTWELSLAAEGKSGRLDIYLSQYDSQKRRIGAYNVCALPGTATVLTAPAAHGAKEFTVADGSKWDLKQGNIAAFDAKADFSDLPNFRHEYYVKKVSREGNVWRAEMSQGLFREHAAGTRVRLHRDGDHMGWGIAFPEPKPFARLIEPAGKTGGNPGHWWPGTAFVRLALRTTSEEPVSISRWNLREVSPDELDRIRKTAEAARLAEKQKLMPFGFEKILASGPASVEFTNHFFTYRGETFYRSGISRSSLAVPCREIAQFECEAKSEVPGLLVFDAAVESAGKTFTVTLLRQSVIPDGKYRKFIFRPADSSRWPVEGTLRSWNLSLREYPENGRVIGFRNPEFRKETNLIAGADKPVPGKPEAVNGLFPLGKYRLEWRGGTCPGVTVNFYDHLLNPIPGSRVRLAPGKTQCGFTAPEMLIRAEVSVDSAGAGRPVLVRESAPRRYTPELFWRGKWIWSRHEYGPDYANVWFRKEFDLKAAPEYAAAALMADDVSDTYVNGTYVGKTWPYSKAFRFDITRLLKPGRNRIDIRVYNLDSAAGLCGDFYVKSSGGDLWFSTDSGWLCRETGKDKNLPEKIDSPAVELGPPATTPPWTAMVHFAYVGPRGKFALLKSENGRFTAKMEKPVVSAFRTMNFERRTADGKSTRFLLPASMAENSDGTVTVTYPKLRPLAVPCEVRLDDDFWEIEGNRPLAKLAAEKPFLPGLKQAEFVNAGTRTMLKFNGKLRDPVMYVSSEWERMAPARAAGFRTFVVNAPFHDFWLGEGKYDFSALDHEIETLLTFAPDAAFLLDIRFYMPEWWLKQTPDDTSAYFEKTSRNTYDDLQALGSKKWLADSEAPLKALIDHVKASPWADRIWGANIGDSRGNEWFWGGARAGQDFYGKPAQPGYSPADLAAFRAMLRRKYGTDAALAKAWNKPGLTIDRAEMPDHRLRRIGAVGSLMSPESNRQIMDWCLFRNQALSEAIRHFGARIKALTDRKWLVGAYYGYMTQLSASPGRSQLITGHNGFLECAKSPDLDFFRAPACYFLRKTGLPNGIMQTWSTFTLRGKVLFIENDQRTAYGPSEGVENDTYAGRPSTALESVGQINREFGMMTAAGVAHYWMDHPRGGLYEPALLAPIAEQLRLYTALPPVKGFTPPETVVVGAVDSIYYSVDGDSGIFPPAVQGVYWNLNYLGIPYRSLVIADLLEKDLVPAHKFYIMLPALVLDQERRKALMERFDREKATVLWLYSAGSCYPDRGPAARFCGDFLGLQCSMDPAKKAETLKSETGTFESRFSGAPHFYPESGYDSVLGRNAAGKPVLVMKKIGGAVHLFSTLSDLPKEVVSGLVSRAGVFRYTESLEDPLWIGNDLVFLYAAHGGEKKIRLPEGLRMRAVIGPLKGEFSSGEGWKAEGGLTYGFLVFRPQ